MSPLNLFGFTALTFMMVMYALERRSRYVTLAFAAGCLLSSAYGFLAGTWPFGVVEAVWFVIAIARFGGRPAKPKEHRRRPAEAADRKGR